MTVPSLCFIVESGTDVRLVDGLAERFDLCILARQIENGIEISQHPSNSTPVVIGPTSRIKFATLVWRYLREHRRDIDCVIVQGYGVAALAANLAGRFNRKLTVMLVCSPVEAYYRCRRMCPERNKPFRLYELLMLQMLARTNALIGRQYIVLSQHLTQVVSGHGSRAGIEVIPIYGVDTKLFSPPEESKLFIKRRLNLPETGKLIFFSSRIAPEKDSETLLKAMRRLLDAGHDLWLLHRSGGYRTFLKEAEAFGLAERVVATDAVHPHYQLPLDYQACDLCVQASREEGLGFSPLEALACGVPVVAAAVGGLRETIVECVTGWSYPVGDEIALAKCIEDALSNPAEAARRTAKGRAMVCEKYDRQLVFDILERMLVFAGEDETVNSFAEAP